MTASHMTGETLDCDQTKHDTETKSLPHITYNLCTTQTHTHTQHIRSKDMLTFCTRNLHRETQGTNTLKGTHGFQVTKYTIYRATKSKVGNSE